MSKSNVLHIVKILLFILVLSFVVDKIIYFTVTKISEHVYSGQAVGKLNQYLHIKDTTKTIVFGSSRANHHIDIKKMATSGYNIGIDGKFIAYSAILIKLLPKDKHQNIILHIDPNVAFRPTYSREEIKSLMVKYHTNDIIKEELSKAKQDNVFQKFYWCIDYNGSVLGILKNAVFPKYNPKGYYGFDPLPLSQTEMDMFKKLLARNEKVSVCREEVKINKTYLSYLEEIITFCKENNKTLITITSPIYEDNCPDDNAIMAAILKEKEVKYYDYTNFFKNTNDLKYWRDYAHMSDIGAEVFSNNLSEVLFFDD
ncbi:hypothetical protein [Mangrovimonas cancribranchiae]|uniref:D-alanyl-lipoteichoic acid biosynthesis protein DltD n=1 Tax=Mangrovimonas cancribranchiae TaxID=3080055 RepID=A0AAU6PAY9_9FLAO